MRKTIKKDTFALIVSLVLFASTAYTQKTQTSEVWPFF